MDFEDGIAAFIINLICIFALIASGVGSFLTKPDWFAMVYRSISMPVPVIAVFFFLFMYRYGRWVQKYFLEVE
jgi:hypothetical protein